MQIAQPLFNMGMFFREMDQSGVDTEDLYHMLRQQPIVKEKPDAKQFEYKEGEITLENVGFKHYVLKNEQNKKEIEKKLLFEGFNLTL